MDYILGFAMLFWPAAVLAFVFAIGNIITKKKGLD